MCRPIDGGERVSIGEFHGVCDSCGGRFGFQYAEVSEDGEGDCPDCHNVIDLEMKR